MVRFFRSGLWVHVKVRSESKVGSRLRFFMKSYQRMKLGNGLGDSSDKCRDGNDISKLYVMLNLVQHLIQGDPETSRFLSGQDDNKKLVCQSECSMK